MIKIINNCDAQKWDEFVFNHPKGLIYQTSSMKKVYDNTRNYLPISLAAIDSENGCILGILQTSLISEFSGPFESFTSRSIIHGGPLIVDGKIGLESGLQLLRYYDDLIRKKAVYSEIRNMDYNSAITDIYSNMGYLENEHFNSYIDLTIGKDGLWDGLKRDKKRGIKKAEKKGIYVDLCDDKDDLPLFYDMLKETYAHAKIPLADYSLFESVFDILMPVNKALFLFAKGDNGKPIAAQLALLYDQRIYAWYTGAIRDELQKHPGDCLIWYLLKYGSENGYELFDFGGGGSPTKKQNLREYKSRFGAEFNNHGRYIKIHSSIKNLIANSGYNIYKKFHGYVSHD